MEFNFGFEVSPGMEAGQEFLYVGAGEVITDGEPGDLRVKLLGFLTSILQYNNIYIF